MELRLADPLVGLSTMADLGFGLPPGESVRACVLATALARRLDLPDHQVRAAFYTGLLQHLGCVGFAYETAAIFGDELAMNAAASRTNFASVRDVFATFLPQLTRGQPIPAKLRLTGATLTSGSRFGERFGTATCEVGRATARRLGLPEPVAEAIYRAYEWWNGKGAPGGLAGDQIPMPARVAALAGVAARFDSIGGPEVAVAAVRSQAGGTLDPELSARFAGHAAGLLAELASGDPRDLALAAEPAPPLTIRHPDPADPAADPAGPANAADPANAAGPGNPAGTAGLLAVATAFADLADLKSPYTHGHSTGVAALAESAGRRLGLPAGEVRQLQLAALLHDLGRVAVPTGLWQQPRPLRSDEWERVRLHPYYSERILAGSPVLRAAGQWAGRHHERLDGSGYHRGCTAAEQPVPVRVLAAADAFQAMTQLRPYRPARTAEQAAARLREQARAGGYDPAVVEAVLVAAGQAGGTGPVRRSWPAGLSDREVEVLGLLARGCPNQEIANRLVISRRTAEHHVQHIYAKIGVSSRAAAALFAMEHSLLPRDG